jgi:iron complex outermembrane receptor protein/vitamin B12 transporter
MASARAPRVISRLSPGVRVIVFVTVAMLCLASGARAQSDDRSVSGTIFDPIGQPLPGVTVTLVGRDSRVADAVTDANGRFAFARVDEGRYTIEARLDGFAPGTAAPFFVGARSHAVVDLTLQIGLRQDVVVTASATALPASEAGASVTVVDRDTIEATAKTDVLDAIRLVPGVAVTQSGARGGVTSVFVRGGAANFNKVLIDGVPANDVSGVFDFSNLAATGVDRVEVLRDANSVLYGSDALAGVISLATRRGTTHTPEASLSFDGGNFGTTRQAASIGGTVQRFDYFLDYSHFDTDNDVPNNGYRNDTFASRFGWAIGPRSDLSLTVRHVESTAGSPSAVGAYGIADDTTLTSNATYVSAALQSRVGAAWETTLRFTSMSLGNQSVNPTPTGEPYDPFDSGFPNYLGQVVTLTGANGYSVTGRGILDYFDTYPIPYDANTTRRAGYGQATRHLARGIDLSAGARVDREEGSSVYGQFGQPSSTSRTNAGAFAEVRAAGRGVFATAGVGYDHHAIFKSAVTPRVSIAAYLRRPMPNAAFGETKLIFNAGTGIKAPSLAQELSSLYAIVQALPSNSRPDVGSLSPIGPERSRSIDVGIEQGWWAGRARVRATYFHNRFSDLIEFVDAGVLPQLGIPPAAAEATGFGAYVNSSSYRARGIEVSGEAAIGPYVRVSGSYTHLNAMVTESFASSALAPATNPAFPDIPIGAFGPLVGAPPFRRPANTGSLFMMVTRGRFQGTLSTYFAGKSDDSTFVTDPDFGNTLLLPNHDLDAAYQKVDASASYRIASRLKWYVSLENLLNQREQGVFGFPALPRSIRTGLTLTLGGDRRPQP